MENNPDETDIQTFYKGSTIFLTGATGFIGKLFLEKILRSLPVEKVYILVRAKKNIPGSKRLLDIFQSPVFNLIKRTNPILLEKVTVIDGDLSEPILGLSKENQQKIIEEVDVIFHCAATTRFDELLKKATIINVKGTMVLIDLAKKAVNLKTFMYMGTAFSNCNQEEIAETIYPSKITAENLIRACDSLDDECLEAMTKKLTTGWPNTYTFTKQVVEDYIEREAKNLPICICRPSIVLSTAEEPIGSFIDSLFTIAGITVVMALGISRITYYQNVNVQCIPVDYVINECIAAGWITGQNFINKQVTNVPVYNVTNGRDNPTTFEYIFDSLNISAREVPSTKMIAYPLIFLTKCKYNYLFWRFFFHTMVGYLFDIIRKVQGKQPRFAKDVRKLHLFQEAYSYFLTTSSVMHTENTAKLLRKMSIEDRKLFNFDIKSLDWDSYFTQYPKGIRLYLLKESMDTLSEGKKHYNYLKKVMIAVVFFGIIFVYVVGKVVLFRLSPLVFELIVQLVRYIVS